MRKLENYNGNDNILSLKILGWPSGIVVYQAKSTTKIHQTY